MNDNGRVGEIWTDVVHGSTSAVARQGADHIACRNDAVKLGAGAYKCAVVPHSEAASTRNVPGVVPRRCGCARHWRNGVARERDVRQQCGGVMLVSGGVGDEHWRGGGRHNEHHHTTQHNTTQHKAQHTYVHRRNTLHRCTRCQSSSCCSPPP